MAERYMISAAHPLAVEAGLDALRAGGNAVDAAVAAQMVLGFVEAPESGLGGGGFLLYREGDSGETRFYDGRERAPAAATPGRFTILGLPVPRWAATPTGRAVGVPGLPAMLAMVHERHGALPWNELLSAAIEHAERGVPMPARLQRQIAEDHSLRLFTDTRRYFVAQAADDSPQLRNRQLAATLRVLAERGVRSFYEGEIAEALVRRARARRPWGSDLTLEDLRDYRPAEREPVCGNYRHWHICGAPPPSSGGIALLQVLGMLEHFDLAALEPGSIEAVHLIAEASRLAFADRNRYVGDPDYVDIPVEGLLDADYLHRRAALIDPRRAMREVLPGEPGGRTELEEAEPLRDVEAGDTTHLSVVDAAGNVVALTSSNEAPFGSRMMSSGFLLNNQLTDFDFSAEDPNGPHPNAVAPGKRPRSSMAPVIVTDAGDTRLVVGSRGGSRIIAYVVKVLIGVLDWGLDVQTAIDLPNFVHRGETLELEAGTAVAAHGAELAALGHRVTTPALTSGLHGIERVDGRWRGGADSRLDGTAYGD